uniref:Uncharacterized protein n=1 Tax=Bracon brevicornis TaxID=1563983 RepID=A0A6V7JMM8_9HYME
MSRQQRISALVIKPTEGKTYADVLSKVRRESALEEVDLPVSKVRKTLSGDILLIINKDMQEKLTELQEKISTALGDDATINARLQQRTFEVTGLAETTFRQEIGEPLTIQLKGECIVEAGAIVCIRKTYCGTKTATLRLPTQVGEELLVEPTI